MNEVAEAETEAGTALALLLARDARASSTRPTTTTITAGGGHRCIRRHRRDQYRGEEDVLKKTIEQKPRRRSPEDIGRDSDLAFKSTLTVAVDRPTAVAAKQEAQRMGTTVSALVRDAVVRALEAKKTK